MPPKKRRSVTVAKGPISPADCLIKAKDPPQQNVSSKRKKMFVIESQG